MSALSRVARPGVLAGVLFFVGAASLGDAPDTRSTTEQIAAYFVTNRNSIFMAVVAFGAAAFSLLWFAARERARSATGGASLSGDLAFGAAVIAAGVFEVGMVLQYATLAYVVGAEAPDSAKAMFELTLLTAPIVSVPLMVLIGSTAWTEHRRHGASARFVVSVVALVLLVPSPFSFADHGAFSPDVQQQVVFNVLIVWLIVSELTRPGLPEPWPATDTWSAPSTPVQ
jgi:hypothetical protein